MRHGAVVGRETHALPLPGWRLAWATAALALGSIVYLFDRPIGHAALLPAGWVIGGGSWLGVLASVLPSFVHPFAFALLADALRAPGRGPAWGACAGWWAVNVAFEIGQHEGLAPRVAGALHGAFGDAGLGAALARPLANYLLRGTFDPGDLAAATLGALAAAALMWRAQRLEERHAS